MEPVTRFHPGSFTGLWNSRCFIVEPIAKPVYSVTPAKAGVQNAMKRMDSGFRWNDAEGLLQLALLPVIISFRGACYAGNR